MFSSIATWPNWTIVSCNTSTVRLGIRCLGPTSILEQSLKSGVINYDQQTTSHKLYRYPVRILSLSNPRNLLLKLFLLLRPCLPVLWNNLSSVDLIEKAYTASNIRENSHSHPWSILFPVNTRSHFNILPNFYFGKINVVRLEQY